MYLSLIYVNVGSTPDRPQPGKGWLHEPYRVHQRLWMAFPDGDRKANDPYFLGAWDGPSTAVPKPKRRKNGFLFRIERDGRPRVLVQSVEQPDWEYAFQNAPHLVSGWDVRNVDPLPQEGVTYRFRLQANVVSSRSVPDPSGRMRMTRSGLTVPRRRRTEVPVHPGPVPGPLPADPYERQQMLIARWDPWRGWLDGLATRSGFRVLSEPPLIMESVHVFVRHPGEGSGGLRGSDPNGWLFNAGLFEGALVCEDASAMRSAVIDGVGHAKAFGFGLLSIAPGRS